MHGSLGDAATDREREILLILNRLWVTTLIVSVEYTIHAAQ